MQKEVCQESQPPSVKFFSARKKKDRTQDEGPPPVVPRNVPEAQLAKCAAGPRPHAEDREVPQQLLPAGGHLLCR